MCISRKMESSRLSFLPPLLLLLVEALKCKPGATRHDTCSYYTQSIPGLSSIQYAMSFDVVEGTFRKVVCRVCIFFFFHFLNEQRHPMQLVCQVSPGTTSITRRIEVRPHGAALQGASGKTKNTAM